LLSRLSIFKCLIWVKPFIMSHYFLAQIKIIDATEYQMYLNEVDAVFKKYRGQYLAVDANPTILEGTWNYTRTVLIRFDSKTDFENWYHSADYQRILKHRLTGAQCDSILIKGLS
jgi:uncharacterized protein (DUF1330 family)